jgi:glycosyltransferase involved in cell wall biosynthesis
MTTAIICTHNPRADVIGRCIAALRKQRVEPGRAELLVVDNNSAVPLDVVQLGLGDFPYPARLVQEPRLGLTEARRTGLRHARGDVAVFVDDDNFLGEDYLRVADEVMALHPEWGGLGGRNLPLTDDPLPGWMDDELLCSLVVRDLGPEPKRFLEDHTPYGAGMVVRREPALAILLGTFLMSDRIGTKLSSGGDSELCYRLRIQGWPLWYEPRLVLHHYLEPRRLTPAYMERLHAGFGEDRMGIELFWYRGTWLRRLSYLRRSLGHALRGRRLTREAGVEPTTMAGVKARCGAAFSRSFSRALFRAAFGSAVWRDVPHLDPRR